MKSVRCRLCGLIAVLVFLTSSTNVYSKELNGGDGDITLAPYFFVEGKASSTDRFPLKETQVAANLNGVIADIYVTQTYTNEGKSPINASYVFPASTKASVHGMKMEIGDNVVTAKIKEREEAKQEFEQAKSEGKSASLLEQQRPNVFTMNVANIMPGDVVRVELHYTELIAPTDGVYQFVFPTVVGPRYASPKTEKKYEQERWVATPYLKNGSDIPGKYGITVALSAGVPISGLGCKSHEIDIVWDGESAAQVTLSNPEEFAGNRDFILDYKLTGQDVQCGLMLSEGETENFFLLMVQPPERIKPEDIPPREYIFVLDVSGSMSDYPLDTAKELLRSLISRLRETDTFNLILFSGASKQLAAKSVPATEENINSAINLTKQLYGGGGTELVPALERAVSIPKSEKHVSRSVVVITDGYIAEEKEIFDIINRNIGNTNFFSFGIGSSVNRHLIDGIAKAGLGEPFVVTEAREASDVAERFREYIQSPLLTDINVTYEGFDSYDIEPPNLPTLFAQRPIILYGKWRGEPSGTIRITGKNGYQDYSREIQVSETKPLETNSAISLLWARAKVERLLDYGFIQDEEDDIKKQVTAIGLKYSMMTPYTSFIAVIDKIRNIEKEATDVNQPLPLPRHVSDFAVGGSEGYTVGSEPGDLLLSSGILLTLLLRMLCRNRNKKAECGASL